MTPDELHELAGLLARADLEASEPCKCRVCALNAELASALRRLLSDLRETREAIGAFVAKYEECEPHITGAFQMAFTVRGYQYTGPNYAAELARLRELARIKELEGS